MVVQPTPRRRMRGRCIAAAVGLSCSITIASCSSSSPPAPSKDGSPQAVIPSSHEHPEPVISRFTTAVIKVPVRNEGDGTLEVRDVTSKWECVRLLTDRLSIPPRQSGTIDLSYAPDRELGELQIPVSFKTNDPDHANCTVIVKCTARRALVVEPAVLKIGAAGSATKETVTIVNRSPRPVRLLYATANRSWLTIEVPRDPIPPGGSGHVTVSVNGTIPKGRFRGSGRISHDLSEVGPLTVAVEGTAP